jgi:hypothetical protein
MGAKPSMPNLPVMFYFLMDENLLGNWLNSWQFDKLHFNFSFFFHKKGFLN